MSPRLSLLSLVALSMLGATACGNDPPNAPSTPKTEAPPVVCPAKTDPAFAREILARHAKAFGSAQAALGQLPLTLVETMTIEGRVGGRRTALAKDAAREDLSLGPLHDASGVTGDDAWNMSAGTGAVTHLRPGEAPEALLGPWLLRRAYLDAFAAERDTVTCKPLPPRGARVDIEINRAELGTPVLAFDLESAALLAVAYTQADGEISATTYEAWSDPDHGVRWPKKRTDHLSGKPPSAFETTALEHGAPCDGCLAPPADRFVLRWPAPDAEGRTLVRLPLLYLGNELLVRAKIGGRAVNVLLDSGADVTAIDSTTPSADDFVAAGDPSPKGNPAIGELPALELGELVAEHLPAARLPMPGLGMFGKERPEVILGNGFFANTVIRVDYKNQQIVIAKSAAGIFAKGKDPVALPVRVLDGKIVAQAMIGGADAAIAIDSGSDSGLTLARSWGAAHGLPGAPLFRVAHAEIGPIAFDDRLVATTEAHAGIVAGRAGNPLLARCDAVVFDVAKRTVWLEGTCDRAVPESRIGWRFAKQVDPKQPERPFVVNGLVPSSPAEQAGVKIGDRLLDVGGKPASADVATWWPQAEEPAGTKLPLTLSRAGAPLKLVIELRDLGR